MSRRKPKPAPATQDALNTILDDYQDAQAPISESFQEARRTGDNAKAARLWEYSRLLMWQKHQAVLEALHPTAA